MANYDLGTIGFTIQNTGANEAINGLNQVAQAANKISPAAQRVIDNMKRLRETQRQVSQANEVVSRSFTKLELDRAAQRMQGFESALANTRGNMNNFGVVTQQVGYQVGDFLVQVQSGTNFMVALGQQATQLVGVLPMMNGLFGLSTSALVGLSAGLGIAIPLITAIGAAWLRSGEDTKDSVDKQKDAIKALREELNKYLQEKAAAGLGVTPEQLMSAEALADAQEKVLDANQKLADALAATEASSGAFVGNSAAALGSAINLIFASEDVEKAIKAQADAQKLVNDLRDKMLDTYEEESRKLADNARLEEARIRFGEESFTYKKLLAEEDRKSYEQSLQTLGLSEGYIQALLNQYDATVKNRKEVEDTRDKAQSLVDLLERFHGSEFQAILKVRADVPEWMGDIRNKLEAIEGGFDPNNIPRPGPRAPAGIGGIDWGTAPESKKGGGGPKESALEKLQKQLDLEKELVGTSEAYQRVRRALGEDFATTSPKVIEGLIAQVEYNEQLLELEKQREQLMNQIESSLENGFMAMVEGTKSVKDAFKSMAYEMIKELYRVLVVQRMVGSFNMGTGQGSGIIGGIAGLLGFRESGGSVMANRPYIVGERGPELVIPRHSGTVMNANQTSGVLSGGGDITVQNNITVTGSDAAMVRAEVAKMIPQITNATKAAVIDAKQRGGQMAAAFR